MHGNNGPGRAKPPYKGDVAHDMGWPRVPPYQQTRKQKRWWLLLWDARHKAAPDITIAKTRR